MANLENARDLGQGIFRKAETSSNYTLTTIGKVWTAT